MNRQHALLLILLGAIWGAIYPLTSVALRELPPPTIVVARTALAALILLPLAIHSGALRAVRTRPGAVLIAALLQVTVPLMLLTVAQQHVSAGLTGILIATQPVWAIALTAAMNRSVPGRMLIGVLLGLLGVVVLFLRTIAAGSATAMGALMLVGAAGCIAAGSIWTERAISDIPPVGAATAAMVISTFAVIPFMPTASIPIPHPTTIGALLALGVVATAGALVLFYTLIQAVGAARANLAGYLDPGFAILYSTALLREQITPEVVIGLIMILAGSYIGATGKPVKVNL